MARFEDLPADQKAVLQLLLKQGKSYDDLSSLLRTSGDAVRDRALAALDSLGPDDQPPLEPGRQEEISDYLLGQQSATRRAATRDYLGGSASGRAWARVVAAELRPIAGENMPDIPAEGVEIEEAFDALQARQRAKVERERSSRVGGILLIAGGGIVIALILIALLGGGDDEGDRANGRTTTTATSTTPGGQPEFERQINLRPAREGSDALGTVFVLRQDGQRAYAIQAQGLGVASPRYVVWLYNSPSDVNFLGFAPPVESNGRLTAITPVPDNASKFKEIVISRERSDRPQRPSTIVLRGPLGGE